MKDLMIVASYTIKEMLKRKSFIISNVIILLIIVIGFNVPNILKTIQGEEKPENQKVFMIDHQNVFEENLESLNQLELGYTFTISNDQINREEVKQQLKNEEIDFCINIEEQNGQIHLEYIVESMGAYDHEPTELIDVLSKLYTNVQLLKLDISPEELASLNAGFDISVTQTDENAASGNIVAIMLLSLVLFYAIYFCAYQVSTSITTEKTSKIMETLVTSTTPRTIVIGKTIGIGIVGLIQVVCIILVSVISCRLFLDPEILTSVLNLSNVTPKLGIITIAYFLLGYALYALLYALTGSTVSKPEDVQSANGPVAVLAVIGFYLAYFSMMNPTSEINVFSSIFPLSSPFSMPFRVMMGTATTSQLIWSFAILMIAIMIIAKISIKIYSAAILNYGTKMNLKDMLKMYKDKNN